MRYSTLHRIQRIFMLLGLIILLTIVVVVVRAVDVPGMDASAVGAQRLWARLVQRPHVALISGHAAYDSGAVCTDVTGAVTLTEAQVNAAVTRRVAQQLRRRGVQVSVLDEHDARLVDLRVDALLSLHSDSCIDESGYKAAHRANSPIRAAEGRFLQCIDRYYPAATDLAHHPNTITHDMVGYYAFNRIDPATPAVILEMGFLGGDQALLVNEPGRVASGIARSVVCFVNNEPPETES